MSNGEYRNSGENKRASRHKNSTQKGGIDQRSEVNSHRVAILS